jgi:uncharacterized protein
VPSTDHDRQHEALDEQECLRLLGTTAIGRVAYTEAALPAIRPVSYTLRDGAVVIPTQADSSLAFALRGAVVAFEADSYDHAARTGWSVTVVGPSWVVTAGPSVDPGRCFIHVRVGLVRGWRTTAMTRSAAAAKPVDDTSVRA